MFWIQIVTLTVLTLINGVGQSWENMTSWPILLDTLVAAVMNPVTVVAVIAAWWATATDPTARGFSASLEAMEYTEPIKTVIDEID